MPSPTHDALDQFFKDDPKLAARILHDVFGMEVPKTVLAREENPVFNTRNSDDLIADTVISLGPPQAPVLGINVEVQQDKAKDPEQLARYAAAAWLMLRCRIVTLVVATSKAVAEFYEQPIETSLPGYRFCSRVLGPEEVPHVIAQEVADASPGLAALSAIFHGHEDPRIVRVFVQSLRYLPEEWRLRYTECAHHMAKAVTKVLLEELMNSTPWIVSTPFAREHFGKGKAEGKAEEGAKIILMLLNQRGIAIPADARERIGSCADTEQLEAWALRVGSVHSIEELFEDDPTG